MTIRLREREPVTDALVAVDILPPAEVTDGVYAPRLQARRGPPYPPPTSKRVYRIRVPQAEGTTSGRTRRSVEEEACRVTRRAAVKRGQTSATKGATFAASFPVFLLREGYDD